MPYEPGVLWSGGTRIQFVLCAEGRRGAALNFWFRSFSGVGIFGFYLRADICAVPGDETVLA